LCVEDSEQDFELLKHHLSSAGYELISRRVESREELAAALEKEEWDLILCDYSMPRLNTDIAFLQKPFTPDVLALKVREVLDAGR
jgi:CheY-like chemotaxis protein